MTRWMTQNWGIKLISLVLAIGLWTYAVSEESIEIKRTIPLKIEIKNPHISVLKVSTQVLQVTLVAQRALLPEMTSDHITAVHEIGEEVKTAGEYSFRLETREIKLPKPEIRVSRIEPEVIHVRLDELITQKLPVKPNLSGDPAMGYKVALEEIQLDPNAVLVQGPKGQLQKVDSALTEPVDLVGRIRPFRRTLSLQLPENVKALSETLIDAYVPIREEFEEKNLKDIPVKIFRSSDRDDQVSVEPSKISFVLKGSKRQLDKLEPALILAYADTSSLPFGDHQVPVKIVLPEEVALKDQTPVLKVSVRKK